MPEILPHRNSKQPVFVFFLTRFYALYTSLRIIKRTYDELFKYEYDYDPPTLPIFLDVHKVPFQKKI